MKKTFTIPLLFFTSILFSQSENWKTYNSINSPLSNNKITSTTTDHENNIFFGTHEGLMIFDGTIWKNINKTNSPLPSNKILSLSVDVFNNKWVGT